LLSNSSNTTASFSFVAFFFFSVSILGPTKVNITKNTTDRKEE